MSSSTQCCKFLRGKVYISEAACSGSVSSLLGCKSNGPMREVGNVDLLNVFIESEVRGRSAKTLFVETPGCAQTIITNVRVQLTLTCTNAENLRLALFGSDTSLSDSGSVVDESICGSNISPCDYLTLNNSGVSNVVLRVLDANGNTTLTLVEGEDYKVDETGIEFISGVSIIAGSRLVASYDYDESSVVTTQPLTSAKGPVKLFFRGTNLQDEGFYNIELHKVNLQPASNLELISSDNFQNFQLNGVVMRDCGKGEGLSQFMEIKEKKHESKCS